MTAIKFFCGIKVIRIYFFVILALEYDTELKNISIQISIFKMAAVVVCKMFFVVLKSLKNA